MTKSQTSEINIHIRIQRWRLSVAKFSQFLKWESSKVLLQIQKLEKPRGNSYTGLEELPLVTKAAISPTSKHSDNQRAWRTEQRGRLAGTNVTDCTRTRWVTCRYQPKPQLLLLLTDAEVAFLHLELLGTDHRRVNGRVFGSMELQQMYL